MHIIHIFILYANTCPSKHAPYPFSHYAFAFSFAFAASFIWFSTFSLDCTSTLFSFRFRYQHSYTTGSTAAVCEYCCPYPNPYGFVIYQLYRCVHTQAVTHLEVCTSIHRNVNAFISHPSLPIVVVPHFCH